MLFHSFLQALFLTQLCLPLLAAKPAIYRLSEAESQAGVAEARRKLDDDNGRDPDSGRASSYGPSGSAGGYQNFLWSDYEEPNSDPYHYNLYDDTLLDDFYGYGSYWNGFYPMYDDHRNGGNSFDYMDPYFFYGGLYSPPPASSYGPYYYGGSWGALDNSFVRRRQLESESTSEEASSASQQNPQKVQKEVLRPQRMMMPMPYQHYYSPPPPMYLHRAPITAYPTMRRPFPPPMQYLHRVPMTGRRFPGNFGKQQASEVYSSVENEHESVNQMEEEEIEEMDLSFEEDREESQE